MQTGTNIWQTMKQLTFFIFCILLISCHSEKKIIGLCADKFIIKDSIVFIDRYDTIFEYKKADTILFWENKYIYDTTTIKTIKNIVKYQDKIIYRENVANIELLKIDNKQLYEVNSKLQNKITELKEELKVYKTIRNTIFAITLLAVLFSFLIKTISRKWL
jgi:hypothetical protein